MVHCRCDTAVRLFLGSVIPESNAIEIICARFRGGIDHTAAGCAILGRIRRRLHRKFLHRFRSKTDHRSSYADAGVVYAVRQNGRTPRTTAIQVEIETRHGLVRSDAWVFAARISRDIWSGDREIKHAAIVQRKLAYLSLGDCLRCRSRSRVNNRRLRSYRNLVGKALRFSRTTSTVAIAAVSTLILSTTPRLNPVASAETR